MLYFNRKHLTQVWTCSHFIVLGLVFAFYPLNGSSGLVAVILGVK